MRFPFYRYGSICEPDMIASLEELGHEVHTINLKITNKCATPRQTINFRNSKINLNPTAKGIRSGIPLRIFDILSCSGFLLTNYQSELSDHFLSVTI